MKIRTKFIVGISLTALATAILFSVVISSVLLREYYRLVDRELYEKAENIFRNIELFKFAGATHASDHLDFSLDRYWLQILDPQGRILFASTLSKRFDIPLPKGRDSFFIKQNLADTEVLLDPEDSGERNEIRGDTVRFRVRVLTKDHPEGRYTIVIAKPLLVLAVELRELVMGVGIGIVAALLLIFLLSYLLATRLLRPLSTINHNIKEIRDNSLSRRIPLGASRDELYILSGSLNLMFDRLQYSFARQKEFISNAAHELKSPLTILMLGHEEMLAAGPPEQIYRELEKQLNTMRRLSRLIRNLLDISRLEQEEICLREPVKLQKLIDQALENYKELLNARNIKVQTDLTGITLLADPEKILRLVINLIDNAIKYNYAEEGVIRVTTERAQDQVVMVIANTSQDIPAEDLPRIFDQFYRVEKSRSQAFGGSGLGLTIAQKIVELHDGVIEVVSRAGWTTFTVTLPASSEKRPASPIAHQ
jgi:signal transduction histidine kinase